MQVTDVWNNKHALKALFVLLTDDYLQPFYE